MAERTVLAVGGNRAVDDSGIERAHGIEAKTQPGGDTGLEILHENIGRGGEGARELKAFGRFQVQRDGLLAGIVGQEAQSHVAFGKLRQGAADTSPVAGAGLFDLEDLRTHQRQLIGRIRSGQNLAEVEHSNTVERLEHGGLSASILESRGPGGPRRDSPAYWMRPAPFMISLFLA